jgi:hypothetical protein
VEGGEGVTVGWSGEASTNYAAAGIAVHGAGMGAGDAIWAAEGEELGLALGYAGEVPEGREVRFKASAGTLAAEGEGRYTLSMPGSAVRISAVMAVPGFEGEGTESDPYRIANYAALLEFARVVNEEWRIGAWGVLTKDIVAEGSDWVAIGMDSSHQYTGTFDGAGHTIFGLENAGTAGRAGLFGHVGDGGVVRNVRLDGVTFNGKNAGGVVGINSGTVLNCCVSGSVRGEENAGGVVGYNRGTVSNCYNTGSVTGEGDAMAGGVAAVNRETVANCHNTGTVSAGEGMDPYAGGVVAYNYGTVVNSYCLDTFGMQAISYNGGPVVDECRPLTAEEYTRTNSFSGWDFENVWAMGEEWPVLRMELLEGEGTESEPYLIGSYEALREFSKRVNGGQTNAWGVVTNDIVATGSNWTAIATNRFYFSGTFDGGGHTISRLANAGTPEYAGLFGKVGLGGVVRNVRLERVAFNGNSAGGVVAANDGTVSNCCVSGSVRGEGRAGGIVAYNNRGTVANCFNTATVSAGGSGSLVGGVAGESEGTVTNCHSTGAVTGGENSYVGGVVGAIGGGRVANSYCPDSVGAGVFGFYDETVEGCEALSAAAYTNEASFSGWDFDNVWVMGGEGPWLRVFGDPPEVYPLWVGGKRVSEANAEDVLGDGSVWFDGTEAGGTLTLSNAVVTGTYEDDGSASANIYVGRGFDLTIVAVGTNRVENAEEDGVGVVAKGNLVIAGDGVFEAEADKWGIGSVGSLSIVGATVVAKGEIGVEGNTGVLISNATVTATGTGWAGIDSQRGNLAIVDSVVTATGENGLCAQNGGLSVTGASQVDASGRTQGIYGKTGVTMGDGLGVVLPVGGQVKDMTNGWTVVDAEGNAALRAVIAAPGTVLGSGTEADPYVIYDYGTLVAFAEAVNGGQYRAWGVLAADIVAEGADWVAIATNRLYFSGTFDGGGHTISRLANAGTPEYAGLFGKVGWGGVVRNVRLERVAFNGTTAGGIVGDNFGTVSNCCVSGSVHADNHAGGIVAYNTRGTVANCFNTATVWSDGSLSFVGGIVGFSDSGTVTNCHSTGAVTGGEDAYVGGVVGAILSSATVANSYCLDGVGAEAIGDNRGTVDGECKVLTAAEYTQTNRFRGWDFEGVWGMGPEWPYLRVFGDPEVYPVWVGGKQVWEENAGDILGNGSARFEGTAAGGTLVLSNAVVTNAARYQSGTSWTACIYAGNGFDLAISLAGSNRVANAVLYGSGIVAEGNLSVGGEGALTIESLDSGIQADGNLRIEGTTVAASGSYGLCSPRNIVLTNATVSATGAKYGIYAHGAIAFAGESRVEATATNSGGYAVLADDGIALEDGIGVALPVGGGVSRTGTTITDAAGNTATNAIVAYFYDITVNGGSTTNSPSAAGFSIEVTANEPEDGQAFVQWSSDDVRFEDAGASPTRFTMPATNVTVEAVFMPIVLTWRDDPAEYPYTGGEIEPPFDVALEGVDLYLGTNYTVSWADNINVGTATLTVTLTNRPSGVQSNSFRIKPKALDEESVELNLPTVGWCTFDGTALQPGFNIKDPALHESDLVVVWTNNVGPGTASVLFTGTNNYAGRVEKTFEIKWASERVDGTEWSYRTDLGGGTNATVTGASPAEGVLTVPGTLGGVPVAGIGDGAFEGCTNLTGFVMGDGVASVGTNAFAGCTGLTNVVLGAGIESVGTNAFAGCDALETVWVPIGQQGTGLLDAAGLPAGCEVRYYGTVAVAFDANGGTTGSAWQAEAAAEIGSNLSALLGATVPAEVASEVVSAPAGTRFGGYEVAVGGGQPATLAPGDAVDVAVTGAATVKYLWEGVYTVTVRNGSTADSPAAAGAVVTVTAGDTPAGQTFTGWSCDVAEVAFDDPVAIQTTFRMSATNVTVTAGFATILIEGLDENGYPYTGAPVEPDIRVELEGVGHLAATNYVVVWDNNFHAGTATVTVTLTNRPAGSQSATFTINPVGLSIAMADRTVVYNGETQYGWGREDAGKETVTGLRRNDTVTMIGYTPASGTDAGTWENGTYDTGSLVIMGEGDNVTGNYELTNAAAGRLTISRRDITNAVVAAIGPQIYESAPPTPAVVLTDGTPSIITTNDYVVSYSGNEGHGTATATITGTNNYTGTTTATFEVRWPSETVGGTEWSYRTDLGGGTNATVTGASPAAGELTVPGTLGGVPVAGIGDGAFEGCTNLTGFVMGDGVQDIGEEAFKGCTGLTNVWLGAGIESVGANAFAGCGALETVWAPIEQQGTGLLDAAGLPEGCTVRYYGTQVVTFDANGGTCATTNGEFAIGAEYGALPAPVREGHDFGGWWDEGVGEVVTAGSVVTEAAERTLTAHWSEQKVLTVAVGPWGSAVAVVGGRTNAVEGGETANLRVPAGAGVSVTATADDGFAVDGEGSAEFGSVTQDVSVAFAFAPAPTATLGWKYGRNANGWFCAQIAIPWHAGYGEALGNLRFLFADRTDAAGARTAYLADTATVFDPLGTIETHEGTEYRAAGIGTEGFAGLSGGERAVYGVSDATMASGLASVPKEERKIALRVVNRDISTVEPLDDKIGFLAWETAGTTNYLAIAPNGVGRAAGSPREALLAFAGGEERPAVAAAAQPRYAVEFDANGGKGTMARQAMLFGKEAKLRKNAFTKGGCVFAGWALEPDGEVVFKDQASVKNLRADGGTAVLYAAWAVKAYAVAFDANGGAGRMSKQSMTYGKAAELRKNAFTKGGCVFAGWALEPEGEVVYKDKAKVKNLRTDGGTATLYAKWSVKGYTVKFDANGGAGTMPKQAMTYGKAAKLKKNRFTKGKCVFAGWALEPEGAVAYKNQASVKNLRADGGTTTLYAKWAVKAYAVEFDANGGEGTMPKQAMTYGKAAKLKKNRFTKDGCVFLGWALEPGGAVVYKNKASVKNLRVDGGTATLYAAWAVKAYAVEFDANGGEGTMARQAMTYGKASALRKNAFTRAGWAFAGWGRTADGPKAYGDRQSVKNLSVDGGPVRLYALWVGKAEASGKASKKAVAKAAPVERGEAAAVAGGVAEDGAGAEDDVEPWVETTTSDGSDAAAVADGDGETAWTPEGTSWAWVVLTFAETLDVADVEVEGDNLPEGMRVLLSEDAAEWVEGTAGRAQYVWVALPPGEGTASVREIWVVEGEEAAREER